MKAVILVGGPFQGTRFRPLSLEKDVPKPLFPVAGHPMIYYHVKAAAAVKGITEILILGYFELELFSDFTEAVSEEFQVPVRFLREPESFGTAGSLSYFKPQILLGSPSKVFVMHCDVFCIFPLQEMAEFHDTHGKSVTVLGKQVPKDEAAKYGCLVHDPLTRAVEHYAEKPEEFISDMINAGVYLFSPVVFDKITANSASGEPSSPSASARHSYQPPTSAVRRLDQNIIGDLASAGEVFLYETRGFWQQVKSAGAAVPLQSFLLGEARKQNPASLAPSQKVCEVLGDVVIHPSAQIHPSCKLGPNVSIGPGVKLSRGVRIKNSIILDNVRVKDGACVLDAIVGWDSKVGQWCRIEGVPDFTSSQSDLRSCGYTILGANVTVNPELIVRAAIVLPHKQLSGSYQHAILL